MLLANICVFILKSIVMVYTVVTLPIYYIIQKPWKTLKINKKIWAKHVNPNDPYSAILRNTKIPPHPMTGIQTVDELFRRAVSNYTFKNCLGKREIISIVQEYQGGVETSKKLGLGDYEWLTYNEVNDKVDAIARGFLNIGFEPRKQVVIFAETRMEWLLALQACLRINVPVVTLYANLGDDGLIHGINETQVATVITSQVLLPKFEIIFDRVPNIRQIIVMEDITVVKINKLPAGVAYYKFSEIEIIGQVRETIIKPVPPKGNDVCVIMYTSGSSGIPKGVILTHKNMITAIFSTYSVYPEISKIVAFYYMAFLPIAHIFEMIIELYTLFCGGSIGYATPFTLVDKSIILMSGCKGDATTLRPHFIASAPILLDKIRKEILDTISIKGTFSKKVFEFSMKYKKYWYKKGYGTPILNRLVFREIKNILGGRLTAIICGSAAISPDTCQFIKICLDVKFIQGYGLVETTGPVASMSFEDRSVGTVGPPYSGCHVRLVDWGEGHYKVTDKPHPRGEIVVGGDSVAVGYYNNEIMTKECFIEENGMRWFYTGDIGEICSNGSLKIIDRKKDLVKLQSGEYVSLSKIESEMKTSPLVNNICVLASPFQDYLIGIVVPNVVKLEMISDRVTQGEIISFYEQCHNDSVIDAVTKLLTAHGKLCGLSQAEIPQKFLLCTDNWIPESGLVTAAFKTRRRHIEQRYRNVIQDMFSHSNERLTFLH